MVLPHWHSWGTWLHSQKPTKMSAKKIKMPTKKWQLNYAKRSPLFTRPLSILYIGNLKCSKFGWAVHKVWLSKIHICSGFVEEKIHCTKQVHGFFSTPTPQPSPEFFSACPPNHELKAGGQGQTDITWGEEFLPDFDKSGGPTKAPQQKTKVATIWEMPPPKLLASPTIEECKSSFSLEHFRPSNAISTQLPKPTWS